MPLYEFKCADCGHELEVLQKISAPAPTECPHCKRQALQKKVTAAGFQLKGTGWYATDFRGGGGSAAAKPTASEDSGPDAAKSATAESAPASAPAPVPAATTTATSQ